MLPCQRHLFDIPDDVAYLNCAYMSPLLRSSIEAGIAGLRRKGQPWTIGAADFFTGTTRVREKFGRLIGCHPDRVALVPSMSYGMSVAAANLPVRAGQRIILLDEGFPSKIYPWVARAQSVGATAVLVPRPEDDDWTRAVLAAVDERTAVAALPHCHWTDGALLDLVAIRRRLTDVGAALAVDATQSLGALPFPLAEADPDFLVAAAYKWMLGPYSVGYLYVAERWHQGTPIEYNWIAREGSEDFAGLVRYRDAFQPGARRFDMGEVSNFALWPAAEAGLDQLLDWGLPSIARSLRERCHRIAERATALGIGSVPTALRAGHYLGLRFPGGISAGLPEALSRVLVFVSVRGNALRVTPHLYNTDADVDRLFGVLERHAPSGRTP